MARIDQPEPVERAGGASWAELSPAARSRISVDPDVDLRPAFFASDAAKLQGTSYIAKKSTSRAFGTYRYGRSSPIPQSVNSHVDAVYQSAHSVAETSTRSEVVDAASPPPRLFRARFGISTTLASVALCGYARILNDPILPRIPIVLNLSQPPSTHPKKTSVSSSEAVS